MRHSVHPNKLYEKKEKSDSKETENSPVAIEEEQIQNFPTLDFDVSFSYRREMGLGIGNERS